MTDAKLTPEQSRISELVFGNAAKVYDLAIAAEMAHRSDRALRVIDLGCGDAATIEPVLRAFPNVEFVGLEPAGKAAAAATSRLRDLNSRIFRQSAYSLPEGLRGTFDVALSFSTLEHVYRRPTYLATAAAALRPGGSLLLNYDHGHFVKASARDRAKQLVGPIMARFGDESKYQAFVRLAEVLQWCERLGLQLVEQKLFNLRSFKELSHHIPRDCRTRYQAEWLSAELILNETLQYRDELAHEVLTVNLVFSKPTSPNSKLLRRRSPGS